VSNGSPVMAEFWPKSPRIPENRCFTYGTIEQRKGRRVPLNGPYAGRLGDGPVAAGLLIAASQLGGLANAGIVVGQGAAFALAGAAAEVISPATVVALSAGIGTVIACHVALRWRKYNAPSAVTPRGILTVRPRLLR
jgi:hypothetical protein